MPKKNKAAAAAAEREKPRAKSPESVPSRSTDWIGPLLTRKRQAAMALAMFALTWVVFWQTTSTSFLSFGDTFFVTDNILVQEGVSRESLTFAFIDRTTGNWHPLTWISHMADVQMYGLDPGAHHWTSVLIHAAAATMLFAALWSLTGSLWLSGIAAALWAVHPLRAEAVVWVSERKTVLAGLFCFCTLWAWSRWARTRRLHWYAIALLSFAAAGMSSPLAAAFPVVLVLAGHWPLAHGWRSRLRELVPFLAAGAALEVVTLLGHQSTPAWSLNNSAALPYRLQAAFAAAGRHLWSAFWPTGLTPAEPDPSPLSLAFIGLGAASVVLVTAAAIWLGSKRGYLTLGWLWFAGCLLPSLGVVRLHDAAYADRFGYIAQAGLIVAVVWLAADLLGDHVRAFPVQAGVAALLAATVWAGWVQAGHWRTESGLFTRGVAISPNNATARVALGSALVTEGRLDEARLHLRKALEINPADAPARRRLAESFYMEKRHDDALREIDEAIRRSPSDPLNHQSRGLVLRGLDRGEDALASFQKALDLRVPDDVKRRILFEMGSVHMKAKRWADAEPYFLQVLEISPSYFLARKNLAFAQMNQAKYVEARRGFDMLLTVEPGDEDIKRALRAMNKR